MLFSGFLILFLTVIFADGASIISAKYNAKDEVKSIENTLLDENLIVVDRLLGEKGALNEEENGTKTCGQAYKDCVGAIDQGESYNEVCSQTLQCTADYFECRMNESNSTSKVRPTRQTFGLQSVIKLTELEF